MLEGTSVRARHQDQAAPPASGAQSEQSFMDILRVFWRRRLLLCAIVGTIMAIALAVVLNLTPVYTASTMLAISPVETRIAANQQPGSTPGPQPPVNDPQVIFNEMQVIRSPAVLEAVLERIGIERMVELDPTKAPPPSGPSAWLADGVQAVRTLVTGGSGDAASPSPADDPVGPEERRRSEIVKQLQERMSVDQVERSMVIRISYTLQDRVLAADLANAVAQAYLDRQTQAKQRAYDRASGFLANSVAGLQADLERAEQAVEEYRARNAIEGLNSTSLAQQITALNSQIITARTDYETAHSKLQGIESIIRSRGMSAVLGVAPSEVIGTLLSQRATLAQRQAQLQRNLGPDHPQVRAVRAEEAALNGQIQAAATAAVQTLRNEARVAEERLNSLQESVAERQEMLSRLNNSEVELRSLQLQADTKRRLLENFLSRLREVEETNPSPDATILADAKVPLSPSFPKKTLMLMASMLGAIMIGGAAVFITEQADRGLRSAAEVEAELRVRVLSVVPRVEGGVIRGPAPADHLLAQPSSAYAEAMRTLFTVLLQKKKQLDLKGTILFTSAVPNEGKTTLITSLARSIERAGRSVAVVDCDLRHPRVHARFGVPNVAGLTSCIRSGIGLDQVLLTDPRSTVTILPAGPRVDEPQEILRSPRLHQILDKLCQWYDFVLIDAPPILPISDIRILAPLSAQCVVVAKWGAIKRGNVQNGLAVLEDADALVSGVVLNQVDLKNYNRYGSSDHSVNYKMFSKYYKT